MSSPLAEDSCSRLSPHLVLVASIKYIVNSIEKVLIKKILKRFLINSFKKDWFGIVILFKNYTMSQKSSMKIYTHFITD